MNVSWKPTPPLFRNFKKEVFSKAALVSQFIYQIGEYPALRKSSHKILIEKIATEEYQTKFQYIKDCLTNYRTLTGYGRGITGVQVGIPERFSVIYTPEEFLIIVNPNIIKTSEKKFLYPEMCMSANPIIAPIIRPAWIEFEYYNERGERKVWDVKDDSDYGRIMNRVFQHEIDHMEGIINIDIVQSPKQLILESDPDFYTTAIFEKV